jgi:uncharacterized membrane protein YdfJ with MMPL/SSD domain
VRGIAAFIQRRPRAVLVVAALVVVVVGAAGASAADRLAPYDAEDPGSESARAARAVERATGVDPDTSIVAVVDVPTGVRSAAARRRLEQVRRAMAAEPDVGPVASFATTGDGDLVSRDGRRALVVGTLEPVADERHERAAAAIERRLATVPGVVVGGRATADREISRVVDEDLRRAEVVALPLIFLLSLWVFRGPFGALLPPLVGAIAIALAVGALRLIGEVVDVSVYALNLAVGLGLGLAIDYTLLLVSRYREELARSGPGTEALATTLATAGRAVGFSAVTVAGALASLLVFPQLFLRSMGIVGLLVPPLAALASIFVVGALLALAGERVDALAPRRLRAASARESAPDATGGWYRCSQRVIRRPGLSALAASTVLLAAGLPFAGVHFTSIDGSVLPAESGARRTERILEREFRPNVLAPLTIVARDADRGEPARLASRVRELPGVDRVAGPVALDARTTLVEVFPERAPFARETGRLVDDLRALDGGSNVLVGGRTASLVNDLHASLARGLPPAAAVLAVVTVVALFAMTGSLLLPFKALLMSVLTVVAALGTLVVAFQWGALEWLLGPSELDGLEATQPVLLFALAFGLSTDYEVFLLSRIKEARDSGLPDDLAVAAGLQRTGRIVTAAALLFCVAFLLFATSRIDFIQQLGVGTAVAVAVDAMVVRAVLVPALMMLLGAANWWAPPPLRRLHRRLRTAH